MLTVAKRKKRRYSTFDEKVGWMVKHQWLWWHRLAWPDELMLHEYAASNNLIYKEMRKAGLYSPTSAPQQNVDELVGLAMIIINN